MLAKHFIFSLLVFFLVIGKSETTYGQERQKVLLVEIKAEIDPRMNRYVDLALRHAEASAPDLIIIEMDTYGGALNDADDIRTMILEYETPIHVFINKDAASAGALISIACDSIYMAAGASIGAATVVTADGSAAPDKYQSYMRSIMRSTAEAKGRDPQIAEAMVDEDLTVDSISTVGQVVTFSTSEAIKFGFCEGQREDVDDVLKQLGIGDYDLETFQISKSEKVIAFFLNPFVSGILILVIVGGIYFELQTPGVGFPILAAALALIMYLTPYYLNGLAENWEIALFVVGLILIALEIFVIPGFGIAGVAGITMTVSALVLVMVNNDVFDFSFVPSGDIFIAISTTLAGMFGSIIVLFMGGVRLTNSSVFKRIALETVQDSEEGYVSKFRKGSLMGKKGKAYTVLRPSGKIIIDDELYDAYTRGGFINKDTDIVVIAEEGTSLQVKEDS